MSDIRPIIHVVQHLKPGGIEVFVLELARFQSETHPVHIVSLEGSRAETLRAWPRLASGHVPLHFMEKGPGLAPALVLKLAREFAYIRDCSGDSRALCVHTHHVGPLLYGGAAARLTARTRLIHTEIDAWHLASAKRRLIVGACFAAYRPMVVADSPHVAAAASSALHIPLPQVILNGVDTEMFVPRDKLTSRSALGFPANTLIIGISARLEEVKGVDVAIRALAHPAADSTAILVIAGTGSQRIPLGQLADTLGVADRVKFIGHLDSMATFYPALDILCLPSRNEGLPLAILEAQSCGIRVVACDVGGVRAGIDPVTGILVPAGDHAALAAEFRYSDRGNPRPFVIREASLESAAKSYLSLCGSV